MYKDYNGRYASAQGPETPTQLSRSCGSLSDAVRAGRRAEAASTRDPTVPVEVLWRELARVAPTLGIGGPRPALTRSQSQDTATLAKSGGRTQSSRVGIAGKRAHYSICTLISMI